MKERIEAKLKELESDLDMWIEAYKRDGFDYQEDQINMKRVQIALLLELLKGDSDEQR